MLFNTDLWKTHLAHLSVPIHQGRTSSCGRRAWSARSNLIGNWSLQVGAELLMSRQQELSRGCLLRSLPSWLLTLISEPSCYSVYLITVCYTRSIHWFWSCHFATSEVQAYSSLKDSKSSQDGSFISRTGSNSYFISSLSSICQYQDIYYCST